MSNVARLALPNSPTLPVPVSADAIRVSFALRLPEGGPTLMKPVLVSVPATVRVEPPSDEKPSPSSSRPPAFSRLPPTATLAPLMMRSVPALSSAPVTVASPAASWISSVA